MEARVIHGHGATRAISNKDPFVPCPVGPDADTDWALIGLRERLDVAAVGLVQDLDDSVVRIAYVYIVRVHCNIAWVLEAVAPNSNWCSSDADRPCWRCVAHRVHLDAVIAGI